MLTRLDLTKDLSAKRHLTKLVDVPKLCVPIMSHQQVRLTEEEIDRARVAFLEFDKDNSGSIDQVCRFHFHIFFGMILFAEAFFVRHFALCFAYRT